MGKLAIARGADFFLKKPIVESLLDLAIASYRPQLILEMLKKAGDVPEAKEQYPRVVCSVMF